MKAEVTENVDRVDINHSDRDLTSESTNGNGRSETIIPTLHICNGRLGGVGKTTLARLFCERYFRLDRSYTLIDADPSNYNVARVYDKNTTKLWENRTLDRGINSTDNRFGISSIGSEPSESNLLNEQIVFSHDAKLSYLGDRFLEIIDRDRQDIIVSLPANDGFEVWLDANNIDPLMADNPPFKIVNWWCSFGSSTSQQMLVEFINKYPNLHHVCVFNLGITSTVPNWDRFSPLPNLSAVYERGKVQRANILPWLADPAILEAVDLGTPLHKILDDGWQGKPLNRIVKLKIVKWLENNWQSFTDTGFLP